MKCAKCGADMIGPKLCADYTLKYRCGCGHVAFKPTLDAPKDYNEIRDIARRMMETP